MADRRAVIGAMTDSLTHRRSVRVTIPLRDVVKWVRRGKTVTRSLMNAWLERLPPLRGRVLDLGGGGRPSYLAVLQRDDVRLLNMDILLEARPSFAGTLERGLPLRDASVDTVLLLNTLEHVYDFVGLAAEMHRVLRPGGVGLVYVPFLFNYHTHKGTSFFIDDYFRYTESALGRIFEEAGFAGVRAMPVGGYGLVLADLLNFAIPFTTLRGLNTWILGALQRIVTRRRPSLIERFPLGYAVDLRK